MKKSTTRLFATLLLFCFSLFATLPAQAGWDQWYENAAHPSQSPRYWYWTAIHILIGVLSPYYTAYYSRLNAQDLLHHTENMNDLRDSHFTFGTTSHRGNGDQESLPRYAYYSEYDGPDQRQWRILGHLDDTGDNDGTLRSEWYTREEFEEQIRVLMERYSGLADLALRNNNDPLMRRFVNAWSDASLAVEVLTRAHIEFNTDPLDGTSSSATNPSPITKRDGL